MDALTIAVAAAVADFGSFPDFPAPSRLIVRWWAYITDDITSRRFEVECQTVHGPSTWVTP